MSENAILKPSKNAQPVTLEARRKARGSASQEPGFSVIDQPEGTRTRAGVWYRGSKAAHGDGPPRAFDQWVCSPIHVEAITSRNGADFGRLLRFRNTLGDWREWSMPMSMLKGGGEELRGQLLDMGVEIDPASHRLLNSYLQDQRPERHVTAATATGWHGTSLFVMPRRNIGEGDVIFQGEDPRLDDFGQGGTLEGWRATVGSWCAGNPVLMLAVSTALAGPLLALLGKSGGGFHLNGNSSNGKTTALLAAASVWGPPESFRRTWNATGNGLEGIAEQRNDTLLVLDELGEADPGKVGNVVYALANGTGKSRAGTSGSALRARFWRVVVLSSGELGLSAHMNEGGKRIKAGQELRLLELSANRTHGAWDALHGHEGGRHLTDAIQDASKTHHGHAGPYFVERLIQETAMTERLSDLLAAIMSRFHASNGQETRAADRFALAALAGELAITFNLIKATKGAFVEALVGLYDEWRQQRGDGHSEDRAILAALSEFLGRHGDGHFSHLDNPEIVHDRAGYWMDTNKGRVWLFTPEGLARAVPGFDRARVVTALNAAGLIVEHDPDRLTRSRRVHGRKMNLYHINGEGLT